jgi:hypothetical protein
MDYGLKWSEERIWQGITKKLLPGSTFAPLHGLMKSVKKETGIIGNLMALILSGIIVNLARLYPGA